MALMNGAIKLPIKGNFVIHKAMSVRGWVSAFTSMYKCVCVRAGLLVCMSVFVAVRLCVYEHAYVFVCVSGGYMPT